MKHLRHKCKQSFRVSNVRDVDRGIFCVLSVGEDDLFRLREKLGVGGGLSLGPRAFFGFDGLEASFRASDDAEKSSTLIDPLRRFVSTFTCVLRNESVLRESVRSKQGKRTLRDILMIRP